MQLSQILALSAMAMLLITGTSSAQSSSDLLLELRQLRAQMQQMQQELDALKQSRTVQPVVPSVGRVETIAPAVEAVTVPDPADNRVSVFGYGELNYARPHHNSADAVATARRGGLGLGYRFNERTRFVSELEIENAVVSSSDQGEAAFEQLYIEHDIHDRLTAKTGLFLLPIGYLNESHEPTRFYGVTRNLV